MLISNSLYISCLVSVCRENDSKDSRIYVVSIRSMLLFVLLSICNACMCGFLCVLYMVCTY